MTNHFTKTPKSLEQQLDILRKRGLAIANPAFAMDKLRFINYYRFSGYCLHFEMPGCAQNRRSHQFKPTVTFEDVLACYDFDRELRLLTIAAIESLEIGIRTQICLQMSTRHDAAHWYLRPALFKESYGHDHFIKLCNDASYKSKEIYIRHYQQNYDVPNLPPAWVMAEILPMGTWSIIYKNLKNRADRKSISDVFDLSPPVFESWLHSLSYLRNLCAHHQRLWNRQFTLGPKGTTRYVTKLNSPKRFFAQAIVINYLTKIINPELCWSQKILNLMNRYSIDAGIMGFNENWHKDLFWVTTTHQAERVC